MTFAPTSAHASIIGGRLAMTPMRRKPNDIIVLFLRFTPMLYQIDCS
jgi:hypothetical protein